MNALKILNIGITIIVLLAFVILIYISIFPIEITQPQNSIDSAQNTETSTIKMDLTALNDKTFTRKAASPPASISSMFYKPPKQNTSVVQEVQAHAQPKVVYNTTRLSFIGISEQDGIAYYLLKDNQYGDAFQISKNTTVHGFSIVEVTEEYLIASMNDALFRIAR